MGQISLGMKRAVVAARTLMSNIQNFQQYKERCLKCQSSLNFYFVSRNHRMIKNVDNKLQIEFELNIFPAPKSNRFKVRVNVDCESNSFDVDFIGHNGKSLDFIPLTRIKEWRRFTSQLNPVFYKECSVCQKYSYTSQVLKFNHQEEMIEPFKVGKETIYIEKRYDYGLKRYKLINNYLQGKSTLLYDIQASLGSPENILEIPLIKITGTADELRERLDTFITFS